MNMNWLESLIYGLLSGISEFLPISSAAHQQILLHLFGIEARDPVRDFFVHIAILAAVITTCKPFLELVKREQSLRNRNSRSVTHNFAALQDWRVVQGAIVPMLIAMLFLRYIIKFPGNLLISALFLLINGVILFLPERMVQGNKDARSMSALDSILIGLSGALSVFSGLSRVGCTYSVSIARGAAKKHAFTWALLLSISALVCLSFMDIVAMFSGVSVAFWSNLFTYILSGITAFFGCYISISAMRFLVARPSNNGFAFYCWGVSLFSVILYLTVA